MPNFKCQRVNKATYCQDLCEIFNFLLQFFANGKVHSLCSGTASGRLPLGKHGVETAKVSCRKIEYVQKEAKKKKTPNKILLVTLMLLIIADQGFLNF